MRLIGLHARLHAGKDTAYDTLRQEAEAHDLLAIRRAFADPLKVSGMRALGFHLQWPDDDALVDIANAIKETGRVVVTWDGVSESGNVILRAQAITGRQLWQWYGTEAHRADDLGSSFGPDFWVDNLLPTGTVAFQRVVDGEPFVDERPTFWDNFREDWAGFADIGVVTDVRFPNEAERVLELGGEVWKIDADKRLGPNEDGHASEKPLADHLVTRVLDNNGTLAEFQNNIIEALHS